MDGRSLGEALAGGIIALVFIAFLVGGVIGLGGYFGISWLIEHVNISFG